MLKKTITYKDFDGNSLTTDFYFNLTKAELFELELLANGKKGLGEFIKSVMEDDDRQQILDMFKYVASKAVGERSEDGKRFMKTREITDNFMFSDAYSELFLELMLDSDAAASFINGIVPNLTDAERDELAKKVEKMNMKNANA